MKTIQAHTWYTYTYKLGNKLLSDNTIDNSVNKFNLELFTNLGPDKWFYVIFKIRTADNVIRSISTLQRVNKLKSLDLIQIFTEFWNLKAENYEHF